MVKQKNSLVIFSIVLFTPIILSCNEFSGTKALFKLCKKVESQRSQFSQIFDKLLETEQVQNWFFANKDALEKVLSLANSAPQHKKIQVDRDHEQDLKISSVDGKLEAVKEHFYKVLNGQNSNEAIFDKKLSLESDALKEEIKSIKKSMVDTESRLLSQTTLLENRQNDVSERLSNTTEAIIELRKTFSQKMKALEESQIYSLNDSESTSDDNLDRKLKDTTLSLKNQMSNLRSQNEAELLNLTIYVDDRINIISRTVETKLSSNVLLVRESMYNTSKAFIDDLEVLRQVVANTSNSVALMSGQDMVKTRLIEELRSNGRRHDVILQNLSKQVQDLQHTMQDQMQNIRNSLQMSIVDSYQKISDRQNQITQRLSSLVDDVNSIKARVRNMMASVGSAVRRPATITPSPVVIDDYLPEY
ncbi:uncharacterized protein LOC136039275 isoform X2 [Artemia franciscana]|uniref:uncharacterized protein LOC136039275 isoform X2 n=1 Tax=Artemia franciscana TaxID=6661 RepID=UPI0032DA8B51